jgi:endonuclease VIII
VPEGDTVWLTAHRLDQALTGREVTVFDLRVPTLATTDLRGSRVTGVISRGKHILTRLDNDLTLHSHLRMDGSWYLARSGRRDGNRPEHQIRALVGNDAWLATGYRVHDLQIVRTGDEGRLVGHLGPDLLGPDWDAAVAVARLLADAARPIGEALLDQSVLAGIGNMYKSEILFLEGTNPWTAVGDITDPGSLLRTAHRLLRLNRDHPEQSTTGDTGRGRQHWVYLRCREPCLRCGTPISFAEQGTPPRQRPTYWCAACQPSAG